MLHSSADNILGPSGLLHAMYTVIVKRGAKVEHSAEFPNLRDALRQLDGFFYAFPDLVSEVWGASGVLWRCSSLDANGDAEPLAAV